MTDDEWLERYKTRLMTYWGISAEGAADYIKYDVRDRIDLPGTKYHGTYFHRIGQWCENPEGFADDCVQYAE